MDTVIRIGIDAADFSESVVPCQAFPFLFRMRSVGTQGKHHRNILIGNPCSVQLIDHPGQHIIARERPGYITGDDNHLLSRFCDLLQPRGTDRVFQCVSDSICSPAFMLHLVRGQNRQEILFGHLHILDTFSVAKFYFHFYFAPNVAAA